ncbi:MAG: OmpH family outer membrane protein, partial [Bacteroidota bacterium]
IWQGNVDTLANEVQKAITDYEKESPTLTKKEKELSQELIRTKQKRLADYQKAISDKAAQEDGQMTSAVLEEINAYLKSYGESRNYRIIIAATEYGNVAYAADGLDITDEVLNGLNNEYSGQ